MEKEIIYSYLLNLEKFTKREYDNLVSKYNKKDVDYVIEKLIFEDSDNIDKFAICLECIDSLLESKMDLLNYSIYLLELKRLECFDSEKNMKLLVKIKYYIDELNDIFNKYGCDNLVIDKKVPWIADKVNYCLSLCKDIDTLDKLNNLYKNYCNIRDEIVNGNLRYVLFKALEYNDDLTLIDEMIQYGNMGLIRAIEKFEVSKNVSFVTYASYWIRQSIVRGIKSIRYPMRMPMHIIYKNSLLMEAESFLSINNGRSITDKELAAYMSLSLINMEQILNAFKKPVSIDDVVTLGYEDNDFVKNSKEYIIDPYVDVCAEAISLEYRKELLKFLSDYLLEREYRVLYLYYGFSGRCYTSKEIAMEMGFSQQRIGQIKRDALIKLRKKRNIRDIVIV